MVIAANIAVQISSRPTRYPRFCLLRACTQAVHSRLSRTQADQLPVLTKVVLFPNSAAGDPAEHVSNVQGRDVNSLPQSQTRPGGTT